MFVSILQLMGFQVAKPVNSRASEIAQSHSSKDGVGKSNTQLSEPVVSTRHASTRGVHAQANPARRQEVKANSGKAKDESKVTPVVAKSKAASKAVTKTAKPAKKPAAKVKPAAKAVTAPPGKTAGKKAVSKAAAPVKAKPKAPVKPVAVAKVIPATATAKKAVKPATVTPPPKVKPVKTPVKIGAVVESAKPVTSITAKSATGPARAGRPSSRLAQLTVPSMAQSVASTAAKASFTHTMPAPIIVPPLASSIKKDPKLANNWKEKPVAQLTDAELIAMPDEEYMNDTQMAFFRLKLLALKKDILSNAGETTEHLREDTAVVPDPADRATIEEEHALELRTRDRERKLLKKIEQSIVRVDSGDYGYCDETGEPIGVGRLLARPTANLSLEAQQRRELKQKMFGD